MSAVVLGRFGVDDLRRTRASGRSNEDRTAGIWRADVRPFWKHAHDRSGTERAVD